MKQPLRPIQRARFVLLLALLLSGFSVHSQTITIGTGTAVSGEFEPGNPINQGGLNNGWGISRSIQLYRASDLGALPNGATITAFAFNKMDANTMEPGYSATLTIHMKNSNATALASGTAWSTMTAGATTVYSNPAVVPPAASGYWTLPLSTPFIYGGGAIEVYVDWIINGDPQYATNGPFLWQYTPKPQVQAMGEAWYEPLPPSHSTYDTMLRMYNAQITYTPPTPCTGLPEAGFAIASVPSGCGSLPVSALSLAGVPTGYGGLQYQWQQDNGFGFSDFGDDLPTQVIGPLSTTTTYRCIVTCSYSGQSATSIPVVVYVYPIPTAGVGQSPNGPFCAPANTTLTGTGGLTYEWSPETGLSSTTGSSVTCTAGVTTTYTVTAIAAGGCTDTETTTVTVLPSPVFTSVTAAPSPICYGQNSQLSANAVINTPPYCNSHFNSVTYAYITNVTYAGIDNTTEGTIGGPVDYTAQVANVTVGVASNISVSMNPQPFGFIYAWIDWNHNGSFNDAGETFILASSLNSAGPHVLSITPPANALEGNTRMRVLSVSSYPGSGMVVLPCMVDPFGEAEDYTVHVSGGSPHATYTWSPYFYLSSTQVQNPMVLNLHETVTYTVTATSAANFCEAQATITMQMNPHLSSGSTITPANPAYCAGSSVLLTATPGGGGAPYTYAWTGPGGPAGTSQTQVANAPGLWYALITDNCGGTDSVSTTVTENTTPTVSVSPTSATYCIGQAGLDLMASGSGAVSYSWYPADGLSATTGSTVNAVPLSTTTYTVTGTGANGCQATATSSITMGGSSPCLSPTATPGAVCPGLPVQLQANASNTAAYAVSSIPFAEVVPSGTPTTLAINDVNLSPGNFVGDVDEGVWYNIPLPFLFDFYGQPRTAVHISTNGNVFFGATAGDPFPQVLPDPTMPNNLIAAEWTDRDFNVSGSRLDYFVEGTAPDRKFVVRWRSGLFNSPAMDSSQVILHEGCNIIDVMVRATNSTKPKTIGVENGDGTLGTAAPGRSGSTSTIPANEGWRFTPSGTTGISYTWSPSGSLSNGSISNPVASPAGTTTYTVTADNGTGCMSTATVDVTANTPPTVTCPPDQSVCAGTSAFSLNNTGESPVGGTYLGIGVDYFGNFNPTLAGPGAHTITYLYYDGNDCSNTCSFTITVENNLVWYADADGDGYGAGASTGTGCTAPNPGDVTNNSDDCPSTYDPSQANADGDNEGDACDLCPTVVNGHPGDACNDGDPNTFNDVLGASPNCGCAGTACALDLVLEFELDGVSTENWEIRAQGTNALIQHGSAYLPAVGNFSVSTCVPNGCFYLKVNDDGGDGIVGGGYTLRTAGNKRIIDNRTNFLNGAVSQIADNQGWCVTAGAIGHDRLVTASCDRFDLQRGTTAACSEKLTADNTPNNTSGNVYQFWIYNPNGPESQLIPATGAGPNILSMNQITLPAGKVYNIKVRTRISPGVYRAWGPACRMSISATAMPCRVTKLVDDVTSPSWSCGKTVILPPVGGSNSTPNMVVAKPVSRLNANCAEVGANKYRFRFTNVDNQAVTIVNGIGSNYYCYMSQPAFAPCKQYYVEAQASFDNGATWCAYGDACNVYTGGCLWSGSEHMATEKRPELRMYPNPNRGDQLYLAMDNVAEGVGTVGVDIYDSFGKRVSARTIPVADGFIHTVLELNGELASGLYVVNITAGEAVHTERLVIQQ